MGRLFLPLAERCQPSPRALMLCSPPSPPLLSLPLLRSAPARGIHFVYYLFITLQMASQAGSKLSRMAQSFMRDLQVGTAWTGVGQQGGCRTAGWAVDRAAGQG